ncbi:MAG TPA: DUF3106 domain-containing protein [Ramlibacter sp.]|nr:DUF3106 domain-containing protein [Ramlibacter sp.]
MRTPRAISWIAAALAWAGWAAAQTPPSAPPPAARAAAPAASSHAPVATRGAKTAAAPRPDTHPLWRELAPGQQKALAPLSAQWDTLNEAQKRKWIAMSANFPKMSGDEQAKLHSRMTEWVTLSPQQRTMARLNYGETKKLAPDDKKAKWEQYQALSPEEKKALAAKSTSPKPPTTAAAIKPVPREKLASVPQRSRSTAPNPETKAPRIAAAPNQVDHNTLLPAPLPPPQLLVPPPPPAHPLPPQAGTPD